MGGLSWRPGAEADLVTADDPTLWQRTPANAPRDESELADDPLIIDEPGMPRQIGPYRILREIGHGGMGNVFLAEQLSPVRRQVAVKLVRRGIATTDLFRRFEAERQALALMNHPNVAQIYDAGTTRDGFPYFVMEYAPGEAITDFVEQNSLDLRSRLELFVAVCDAIQHAHFKGILHRDIKPSNVLVTQVDGRPVPKVIDFGLAKALAGALTEDVKQTRYGTVLGTPDYMSPEQLLAGGSADTRSDVYSLGALLYELLLAEAPFDARGLSGSPIDEVVRTIREIDPLRPSRRLTQLVQTGETERLADPPTLGRALESDLDWVVLKALDKDPERRYESPAALADDIRRFLDGTPVVARRPTLFYVVRKYARRHAPLVIGSAIALSLIAASLGWGLLRARREARRANLEKAAADEVVRFLVGTFQVSDPTVANGETVTAREILDRGAERLESELAEQPKVRATLFDTLAVVYLQLGLYDRAERMAREALETRGRVYGPVSPEVATSLETLGWTLFLQNRNEEALPLVERTVAIHEALSGAGSPEVAGALNNLAAVHRELSHFQQAEQYYRRAFGIQEQLYVAGAGDTSLASTAGNLATVLHDQQRYEEAAPLHQRSYEVRVRERGADHPETAISLNNLGWFSYLRGDLEAAESYYGEVLAIREAKLGPDHPDTALTVNNLGLLRLAQGRAQEAELYFRRALAARRARLDPGHRNIADSEHGLALALRAQGREAEAGPLFQSALVIGERAFPASHPKLAQLRRDAEAAASAEEVQGAK